MFPNRTHIPVATRAVSVQAVFDLLVVPLLVGIVGWALLGPVGLFLGLVVGLTVGAGMGRRRRADDEPDLEERLARKDRKIAELERRVEELEGEDAELEEEDAE